MNGSSVKEGPFSNNYCGAVLLGLRYAFFFDDVTPLVVGILWLVAPLLGHGISMPLATQEKEPLQDDQETLSHSNGQRDLGDISNRL